MKKFITAFVLFFSLSVIPFTLIAQNPPHPNGGSGPDGTNTPVGGGAPIGGGLIIMTILGSAYALKKTIRFKAEE